MHYIDDDDDNTEEPNFSSNDTGRSDETATSNPPDTDLFKKLFNSFLNILKSASEMLYSTVKIIGDNARGGATKGYNALVAFLRAIYTLSIKYTHNSQVECATPPCTDT